jgi:hypothetical protein
MIECIDHVYTCRADKTDAACHEQMSRLLALLGHEAHALRLRGVSPWNKVHSTCICFEDGDDHRAHTEITTPHHKSLPSANDIRSTLKAWPLLRR